MQTRQVTYDSATTVDYARSPLMLLNGGPLDGVENTTDGIDFTHGDG